jgi:hypothetical protein
MAILVLTIFLSVLFAAGFTAAFVASLAKSPARSLEQQSLLPLEEETRSTTSR